MAKGSPTDSPSSQGLSGVQKAGFILRFSMFFLGGEGGRLTSLVCLGGLDPLICFFVWWFNLGLLSDYNILAPRLCEGKSCTGTKRPTMSCTWLPQQR